MKRVLAISIGGFSLLLPAAAHALEGNPSDEAQSQYPVTSTRRSEFTAGASYGLLTAASYGYPNTAGKIDNDAYVADTGIGFGSANSIWIGGALRDWFSFGLGVTGLGYKANGLDVVASGFIFRTEVFPLFAYGGAWRDIGAYASFGIGGMTLKKHGETKGDGGSMSIVELGAFWEPVRFSIFSFGPSLEYTHLFSRSAHLYGTTLSARLVLYTGP
jgi:hypothetical protein